jgi:flavin-dependent dehydrogenase
MAGVERFDAIVIGAGPAGGSAALHLARAGWAVAVVERKTFPRRKVCGEFVSGTNLPTFEKLGIAEAFTQSAGPPIRRAGFWAYEQIVEAPMPASRFGEGRALSRQKLDELLLLRASEAGATLYQPSQAVGLYRAGDHYQVPTTSPRGERLLQAPVIVAAHGSWDGGTLPTQPPRRAARPRDLLAFKAHFTGGSYPRDLMPLLAFEGGYGGMTPVEGGRTSLSVCVQRHKLEQIRNRYPGTAGEAILAHLRQENRGVRESLEGAQAEAPWIGAGPLRPGLRIRAEGGIFRVGNAAGEANPTIAEGISMGLQAGALLATHLQAWASAGRDLQALHPVGQAYCRAWRSAFTTRWRLAGLMAQYCMNRTVVACSLPVLVRQPGIVSWFARRTGKTNDRYLTLGPAGWAGQESA